MSKERQNFEISSQYVDEIDICVHEGSWVYNPQLLTTSDLGFGLAVLGKRFFGSWDASDALKPDKDEP